MRRLVLVLAVLGLLAASEGPALAFERFPTFDRLAGQVVGQGRPVDVRCSSPPEWAADPALIAFPGASAYTQWQGGVPRYVVLGPRVCLGVLLLVLDPFDTRATALNPGVNVFRLQGESVFDFAHELGHLSGVLSETEADCIALRVLPGLLATLGVRGDDAQAFQALAQRLHTQRPAQYRQHPCPA